MTEDHAGKYVVVKADERAFPVMVISVGDGLIGCAVLDPKMPMRSFKVRYNVDAEFDVFDTAEEAQESVKP